VHIHHPNPPRERDSQGLPHGFSVLSVEGVANNTAGNTKSTSFPQPRCGLRRQSGIIVVMLAELNVPAPQKNAPLGVCSAERGDQIECVAV
jgi:hypothetical protein